MKYDQTVILIEHTQEVHRYSTNAALLSNRIKQIEELKNAVNGGEIGEDGQNTFRCVN